MPDYSYAQLEQLWIQAGGSRALAPLMAAIALAESGGNPTEQNDTDNNGTQTSWGLWQISNGTHQQPVDGILNPLTNAQQAVAKYQSQGLGAWGTYTSGAYEKFYKSGVAAGALPQGGTGTQQATLTGFSPGDLQWLEGPQGIMQAISGLFSSEGTGAVSDVDASAKAITLIASEIGDAFQALEWFFVPSHWVRIISFWVGVFLLVPGLKALMQSAQGGQGDASLAIGILLITLSGVAFFLAFHNLPDDVDNLQSLLGWITESIREGKAADSATTTSDLV